MVFCVVVSFLLNVSVVEVGGRSSPDDAQTITERGWGWVSRGRSWPGAGDIRPQRQRLLLTTYLVGLEHLWLGG